MEKIVVNTREAKIIELLSKNEGIKAEDLSYILSISTRTLRDDIKDINELFGKSLIVSSQSGYKLLERNILPLIEIEKYNRPELIVMRLLEKDSYVDLDEFADELYVSKTTLINDLKKFNFSKYTLEVVRENNQIMLKGNEYSKRLLIKDLIFNEIKPLYMDLNSIKSAFTNVDIEIIEKVVNEKVEKYNLVVENSYRLNLILNVIIIFYRISLGFHSEKGLEMNNGFLEYKIAQEICETVGESEQLNFDDNDVNAIANAFVGQLKHRFLHETMGRLESGVIDESFKEKVRTILKIAFNHYMINVSIEPFIDSFITHCDQLVRRARQNNLVSNLLEKSTKNNFPFIYDVAVYISNLLEYEFNIKINDSEISYLAIHVGFAIENSERGTEKVKILIYSNNYLGIKNNILEKLNHQFGEKIILTNIETSLPRIFQFEDYDLLISTEIIPPVKDEQINISYMYTDEDSKQVEFAIDKISRKKKNQKLKQDLLNCFQRSLFTIDPEIEFKNKYDVIEYLGKKTIEFGIEKKGYIESIIEREKLSSTLFADSFAIPHPLTMSAEKTMFNVLISNKGIDWDGVTIHAVFLVAIRKNSGNEFMKFYNNFAKILTDEYKLAKLTQSGEFEKFFWRLAKMLDEF